MAGKSKTVAFYYLEMRQQQKTLSASEVQNYFDEMYYSRMHELTNGHRAITVEQHSENYVFEMLEYKKSRLFMKIGRQNPSETVALRDQQTLESEEVPMKKQQMLELFTYCLYDFKTGIISYMGMNSAPKISAVRELFRKSIENLDGMEVQIAAIMTEDIAKLVQKKKIVSKMSVTVAVPSDDVLEKVLGLNMDDFDLEGNQFTKELTFKITGKRNRNMFLSSESIRGIVDQLQAKHGSNLLKVSANAKNEDEKSQEYDLLHYKFTKKVEIDPGEGNLITELDFKLALTKIYSQNKVELQKYAKIR